MMKSNKIFKAVKINEIQNKQKISNNIIWVTMILISIIHGLMCISQGILSSCVTEIKHELCLSDEEFSFFGTINGLGSLIGSLIFTLIINKVSHKYLITSMLLINSISHFAFFFELKFPFLLLSRFISGFATVFCYIYFPMWVDKFGIKNWLNFMQTTVQVSNTIGKIFGYFIYYLLGSRMWKYGFLSEIFSICCLVIVMVIIPDNYFDNNNNINNEIDNNNNKFDNYNYNITNNDEEIKLKIENNLESNNNINNIDYKYKKDKNSIIKNIICNIPYILISLSRSIRFFVYVAIDFWFSDYIQSSLLIYSSSKIFTSYSLTIVLSPLIGLIIGGILSNKIGGPKGKHSFKAMFYLQLISTFFGFFSNFTQKIFYFTIFMSLYMLFDSASSLISISASYAVVNKKLIGTATGFFSFMANLIGLLPAPYTYAYFKNTFKNDGYIISIFMGYGLLGTFLLGVADIYMKNNKSYIYKDNNKFYNINNINIGRNN